MGCKKTSPKNGLDRELARGYLASHDKLCPGISSSISRAPPTTK